MTDMPSVEEADPVGLYDIARRLGVKPATPGKWRTRGIFDILPSWTVSGAPVWHWPDVARWHKAREVKK